MNILKYFVKNRKAHPIVDDLHNQIEGMNTHLDVINKVEGKTIDAVRSQIISAEAHAAKRYWKAIKLLINEKEVEFPGRDWKLQDPINMMFNYGYSILRSRVTSAVIRAGLETYAGFFHVD